MSIFDEMNKTVREFIDHINSMLENDEDIKANSVDELKKEIDKIGKK